MSDEREIRVAHGSAISLSGLRERSKQPATRRFLRAARRKLRVLSWLPSYSAADLLGDARGGLTVAVLLVPQAIAHALLVEVPPHMGLYASLVPLMVFSLFTSSRHLAVGPFALISIIVGSVAEELVPEGRTEGEYVNAVLAISLVTGVLQLAMGVLRLGVISTFLADPSIEGFTSAVALIIMASQLKYLLGVPLPHGTLPVTLFRAARALVGGQCSWWAFGTTALAYALMAGLKELGARCCWRGVPVFEQLLVVALFTALQAAVPAPIDTIGALPRGLPAPAAPVLPSTFEELAPYVQAGLVVAFTSFLVSMSIARAFAARSGYVVSGNQELIALGLANCAGGFFGAFPISGSFSRTAVGATAGVRTPLHGVVQAAVVALVLIWLTPLFRTLPFAVLAAIIISALRALVNFGEAARLWRSSRPDFALWLVAFASTCLFDVQAGLVVSICASLGLLVLQTSRPSWAVLGALPGTGTFRDVTRYRAAVSPPHVLILRFNAPLHFANVAYFAKVVRASLSSLASRGAESRHLVLDCASMHALDASANASLRQLLFELKAEGVAVLLAGAPQPLRDGLRQFGTLQLIGEDNLFPLLADAVQLGCARPPEVRRAHGALRASLLSHVRSHASMELGADSEDDERSTLDSPRGPRAGGGRAEGPIGRLTEDDGYETASERSQAGVEEDGGRRRWRPPAPGAAPGMRRSVSFACGTSAGSSESAAPSRACAQSSSTKPALLHRAASFGNRAGRALSAAAPAAHPGDRPSDLH